MGGAMDFNICKPGEHTTGFKQACFKMCHFIVGVLVSDKERKGI